MHNEKREFFSIVCGEITAFDVSMEAASCSGAWVCFILQWFHASINPGEGDGKETSQSDILKFVRVSM